MKKRGQITLFIVVGIVILFAVGFVLYVASLQTQSKLFASKESEIQQFIGVCLEETAKEGITRIGVTGGYLDIPQQISLNERSYFSFGTRIEPKIPLWYYRGEPRAPTKEFIGEEISKYVVSNINSCIGNFDVFKQKYAISQLGNVTAETTISDTDVVIKLNYPLELEEKQTGVKTQLDSVARTMDVKLGRMYDMAIDILNTENRKTFFENATMDLLASNKDFPFTLMEFSCTPKIWKKTQLIELAKNMIYYNIQKTTVQGNKMKLFNSDDTYAKNNFVLKLNNVYNDIGAAFVYSKSSRLELHVRPNDREVLVSNVGRPPGILKIVPFCINTHHFTYDIEYPLLATLRDDSAFSNTGFVFNFAFPVTINHNAGDKTDFPITMFESPDVSYDFCTTTEETPVDIRVRDAFTFEEIYKANVQYKCVKYSCDLGQTDAKTGIYRLFAKLPSACTNGLLTATMDGYLDGSTVYDGSGFAEILIKPKKKFAIDFVKHDSNNFKKTDSVKKGETIALMITGITDPSFQQIYTTDSETKEIELVDGDAKYNIEALIVQDGERLIGGYVGDLNIKFSEIYKKSKMTINLVQYIPIAVTEEEQGNAAMYLFDNTSYQEPLRPTFS